MILYGKGDKMCKIQVNEKLKHLTTIQIEELMELYYRGVKTSGLIEKYKIDIIPSKLYTLFPPEVCKDEICPNCNIPLVKDRKSKSASKYTNTIAYCLKCGHSNTEYCKCNICEDARLKARAIRELEEELEKKQKIKKINEVYGGECEKRKIESLSFRERVYLGALLRCALSEDMSTILPLDEIDKKLAPSDELACEILRYLNNNNVIRVNPNSSISAFVDDEDTEFPNTYYIYKVKYLINIDFNEDYKEGISKIINPRELKECDKEDALNIWKEIALEESLEYLQYQMGSVRFNFNVGDKTKSVFKDMLEYFSVSQIYGIIFKSIANATKYYQESSVSKKQAANSVIGGCQRYAERAMINNWDMVKYSRIKELPQSIISEFFFDRVIGIGSLGFNMPPSEL